VDAGPLTVRWFVLPRRTPLIVVLVLTVALAGAACSDDDGGVSASLDPTTTSVDPAAGGAVTTTIVQPVGDPVRRDQLVVGDCFNSYDSIDVTTRVPCDGPHFGEVFHFEFHPAPFGEPYPNERELEKYAMQVCYSQFAAFDGGLYEVSRLDIGVVIPTREQWEDSKARYRGIICYLHDEGGEELVGSMRGRGE
jgi:hypothetical protein